MEPTKLHISYNDLFVEILSDGSYITANDVKLIVKDGKLHNDNGPAFINSWAEYWFKNGEMHREDGPAITYIDNTIGHWYLNGVNYTWLIEKWIKEHNYPDYKEWSDAIKIHFKLTFL